jgi:thiol-disulfide isomerase/thioredoxin
MALAAALGPLTPLVPAQERTRSVDAILEEARAIEEPPFDAGRKGKPGYAEYKQRYRHQQHEVYQQRAALLLEACTLHPDDERVPKLMNRRWVLLGWNQDPADVAQEILADISSVLASNTNAQVAADGAYWRAYYRAHQNRENPRRMMECVEPFLAEYAEDSRGADLLELVADDASDDLKLKTLIYRRLAEDYPETYSGKFAPGVIRQIENLGNPFTLSFNDVVTGQPVSIAALRGRVVVIDFWATSCPPCIAEMPHLKELYTKYHQAGVEFIGVSLDEPQARGGLEALRAFIKKYEIPWPQYYQGGGYDSAFSRGWGIGGIPKLFIIDKAGRLRTTEARGKLDTLIPELLAE